MTTISSKTILRSRNASRPDKVLSALLLRYPRWIHAEARTHRLLDIGEDFQVLAPTPSLMECDDLSRNAGSSRAIPVNKLIDDVLADPAIPLFWGMNQRGMQAREELPSHLIPEAKAEWLGAMTDAVKRARRISNLDPELKIGAHKQIVNRLLEPFSHITVLVSATEWSNFRALRDHPDAEPHIRILAQRIGECLDRKDDIQTLQPGQWHLPFSSDEPDPEGVMTTDDDLLKLSVARCASTSYKTVDGFDMTLDRAVALHDKLVAATPLHASPCEHVAQADEWVEYGDYTALYEGWQNKHQHGNFQGFRQYRKMLPGECL